MEENMSNLSTLIKKHGRKLAVPLLALSTGCATLSHINYKNSLDQTAKHFALAAKINPDMVVDVFPNVETDDKIPSQQNYFRMYNLDNGNLLLISYGDYGKSQNLGRDTWDSQEYFNYSNNRIDSTDILEFAIIKINDWGIPEKIEAYFLDSGLTGTSISSNGAGYSPLIEQIGEDFGLEVPESVPGVNYLEQFKYLDLLSNSSNSK